MRSRSYWVYILANRRNGTLYVGVTSRLSGRLEEHKRGLADGFTRKYGIKQLVWCEQHETAEYAITREKQIKSWNRAWKIELIEASNPYWSDLSSSI
jgi:putative endonuclease